LVKFSGTPSIDFGFDSDDGAEEFLLSARRKKLGISEKSV